MLPFATEVIGGRQTESRQGVQRQKGRFALKDHAQYGKKFHRLLLDYMLADGHRPSGLNGAMGRYPKCFGLGFPRNSGHPGYAAIGGLA